VPISKLFPGLQSAVEQAVDRRLGELETELQRNIAKPRRARLVAQKLAWFDERRAIMEN
jgi:hypothetical protein